MDDVNSVIKHGQELLHLENDEEGRVIPLENEIVGGHDYVSRVYLTQTLYYYNNKMLCNDFLENG